MSASPYRDVLVKWEIHLETILCLSKAIVVDYAQLFAL
jgi:hypothetical protein